MLGKELLQKIKQVTNEILFQSEEKPVLENFKTEKQKDSEVEVKYSELAVGSEVYISSASGDELASAGQYDLDSGVSFIVGEDGKISEVLAGEPEPEVEEELAEPAKEDEPKEEEAPAEEPTDKVSELKEKIAELQSQLAELESAFKTETEKESVSPSKFSALEKDVKSLAELLSAIAATPSEFSKTDDRAESTDSKNEKNDRLKHLADIISQKNNK